MSYRKRVLLRGWGEVGGGVLLWIGSLFLVDGLLERDDENQATPRALAILLAPLAGLVALLWAVARNLKRRDEMERHVFGLAAITSLITLLAVGLFYGFYRPLMDWPVVSPLWWIAGAWVLWWISFHIIRRLKFS